MYEQRKRILNFETSFSSLYDGGSFLMSAPGCFVWYWNCLMALFRDRTLRLLKQILEPPCDFLSGRLTNLWGRRKLEKYWLCARARPFFFRRWLGAFLGENKANNPKNLETLMSNMPTRGFRRIHLIAFSCETWLREKVKAGASRTPSELVCVSVDMFGMKFIFSRISF